MNPALAQQDFSEVEIVTESLSDTVHMLTGAGGNLGVSVGSDGVFVIDDQFAPLSKRILAAIGELSDQPVKYVLNTHWHGDHTGGNENMSEQGAVIVAHANVRKRLSTTQFMKAFGREVPASPDAALPVITFTSDVAFHFNGDVIRVTHRPAAHTDGDSVVRFVEDNILHMGDTFFNGFFPFIDQSSGGTLDGVIAAVEAGLDVSNGETRIIPGHGPLANREDLDAYLSMLKDVRAIMSKAIESGRSRKQILADNPLGKFDKAWGQGFMKTGQFTTIVYDIMASG